MNVELAVVADYANTSADGKLNILGIFNTIFAVSYPAVHPDMKLVIRFGVHPSEIGPTRRLAIQLRSDDGRKVLEAVLNWTITPSTSLGAETLHADQVIGISGLRLEAPGSYEFVILVNDEVKAQIPFKAMMRPAS